MSDLNLMPGGAYCFDVTVVGHVVSFVSIFLLVIVDRLEVKKATRREFFLKHFTGNGDRGEYFRVGGRGGGEEG